ncbi:MAG TPA: hypothetical protein VN924_18990 [Bryobacteraceae bacterium]|nr:hypothetical protein [Bryobacteraceae bacterium]
MKTIAVLSVLTSAAVLAAQTPAFGNHAFGTPSVGGCPNYQYQPSGATWTFVGSSGITAAGCGGGFDAPPAPAGGGDQVGFIQSCVGHTNPPSCTTPGTLSQTVGGFAAGHAYVIDFYAAGRSVGAGCGDNCTELNFSVFVGSTDILDVTNPPTRAFQQYETDTFTATGSATIRFSGTAPAGSDQTSFISLVTILDLTPSPGGGPPEFTISTVAGDGTVGFSGDGGPATSAALSTPFGVAVDGAGNIYIADFNNVRIRKVTPAGIITTVAGTGVAGFGGDGGPAVNAMLNRPSKVSVDAAGNFYVVDSGNSRIRKVTPDGTITTVAGNGNAGESGDGGPAIDASLDYPEDVTVDAAGDLFIADGDGNTVREVTVDGTITTVAGNGQQGYSGDGGGAAQASLNNPSSVAVDSSGNLFIGDTNNNRIRKVANGIITTVAGNGVQGYSGDGGPAAGAELAFPTAKLDTAGNLYIGDIGNSRVRLMLTNGTIWTVAGNGNAGFGGDGGPALDASLHFPNMVAPTSSGDVYVADAFNERIRLLTPVLQPPSISAGGVVSASSFGEFTSVSPGSWIEIYGSNLAVDSRSWLASDFNGVNAPTSLDGTSVTIGGEAAFIDFISPGQVNALVPSNVATGAQLMTVTVAGVTSPAYSISVNPVQPGLDAPASFKIGGIQYVVALFADGTYVLPEGAIAGLTSRPAQPGDEIVMYGIGFGPVTSNLQAGQLVQESNTLASPFEMSLGGVPVTTMPYYGLAPSYTGLYQFNVVVPPNVGSGAMPLMFTVGGTAGTQILFVATGN